MATKKKSTIEVATPKATIKTKTLTIARDGHGYVKGQKVTVGVKGENRLRILKLI